MAAPGKLPSIDRRLSGCPQVAFKVDPTLIAWLGTAGPSLRRRQPACRADLAKILADLF